MGQNTGDKVVYPHVMALPTIDGATTPEITRAVRPIAALRFNAGGQDLALPLTALSALGTGGIPVSLQTLRSDIDFTSEDFNLLGTMARLSVMQESFVNEFVRVRASLTDSDAQDAAQIGQVATGARLFGFNGATFDRLRTLDPSTDGQAAALLGALAVVARLQGFNGATFDRLRTLATNADAQAALQAGLLGVVARGQAFNGVTWDRVRTPNIFRQTLNISAVGPTTVWTPAAGRRFRLMAYKLELLANASLAVAGNLNVNLTDGVANINLGSSYYLEAAAVAGSIGHLGGQWVTLGNGYLSTAVDNPMLVNLNVALATGSIRINTIGTEE